MKRKKNLLRLFSLIALLLMLAALIDLIFSPKFLFVNHVVNYFHVANSFLLLAIFTALYPLDEESES
jgi:ribose/xylose/arabinose/galactoside ABC-type transport system permease subunit